MPTDLSQVGASAAVVLTVILFLKYMKDERDARELSIKTLAKSVDRNTKASKKHLLAIDKQIEASSKQRDASHEVLTFMKKLNGKLEGAVIQKVTEQNIEHQHVEHQDVKPQ
jgi:negative regulator of sigma E activity